MKQLDPTTITATARRAAKAERAARPRKGVGERPRGSFVECVLEAGGERITFVGHSTHAIPLYALAGLDKAQRATGVLYGAMFEEIHSGGIRCVSVEAMPRGGGGAGPEGAVDRRLFMRNRVALAQKGLDLLYPMRPLRAARRPKGKAELGKVHTAGSASGKLIDPRQPITARAMVDAICIEGVDMAAVLRAYGWEANRGNRVRASDHLANALSAITFLWGGEARGTGRQMQSWCKVSSELKHSHLK